MTPDKDIRPIVAVDFDGTLVSNKFPEIGEPNEKALALFQRLHGRGYRNVLWTCRTGAAQDAARRFCDRLGLPLWGVNVTPPCRYQDHISHHSKMYADIYVDDAVITVETLLHLEKGGFLK